MNKRSDGGRISVAMCTYNGTRFVSEQLQSIAAQTRLPDELIICDDRSRDGTIEIIKTFAQRAPFAVRLEINDRNYGPTKNFEKAISLCEEGIIVLADQDDVWQADKLSRIVDVFDHNRNMGAVFSDAELIDQESQPLGGRLWRSFRFTAREQRRFKAGQGLRVLLKHAAVTGATMAFRSEFRGLTLPIPANHVHDHWIALLIASVSHLAPIDTPLVSYRQHGVQQIGPGSWNSLSEAMEVSKSAGRDHYFEEAERFKEVLERISDRSAKYNPHSNALRLLGQKIRHRRARGSLPNSRILRIPLLAREIGTARYWRYSNGFGSIAKDLLV